MSRTNRRLERNGISHDRYMELVYFCKQYDQKKEKLKAMTYIQGVNYNGSTGGGAKDSSTERTALERAAIEADIKLIDDVAKEVAPGICEALILNVTKGISFVYLNVPCGHNYFYKKRREFFKKLAAKKKG